ncbi:hypothetical protein K2173_011422 [Erythroxylum novogranatense]|uniref:Uncharacterized protein n=1 Tax=Erythroxylum novogranatense TaxID=1862640 RepID=A0AAV8S6U2_9ROSI|nr:hypothetical protein K2173_011422 [Erythroxylum novogranatense]
MRFFAINSTKPALTSSSLISKPIKLHWRLSTALALRPGGPPLLRLTGIGSPSPDDRDSLREIGVRHIELARSVNVRFAFRDVAASGLQDVKPWMLQVNPKELVDSLEACALQPEKALAEMYIQREICNVESCEGSAQEERHEPLAKWRERLRGAGFKALHLGSNAFKQARTLLTLFSAEGYSV